jgi:pimeloyl-ACP methyl ester carboxylesterase
LVIAGDDDQIVPIEASRKLAEDIPRSVFKLIGNCGHLPQEACREAFMQIVIVFPDYIQEVDHE